MNFTVTTWNVLADAYVRPDRYPGSPTPALDPARRRDRVIARLEGLGSQVVALQEVAPAMFQALEARLGPAGYSGRLAMKHGGRPDGCALFWRGTTRRVEPVSFDDGTGHVALLAAVEVEGRALGIATSHLKWDPPGTPAAEQAGLRQLRRLREAIAGFGVRCDGWIACGDFNATADSLPIRESLEAGWRDPFANMPRAETCVANGRASRIDFLLVTGELFARPTSLPALEATSVLPSDLEPSDHLPVSIVLTWSGAAARGSTATE